MGLTSFSQQVLNTHQMNGRSGRTSLSQQKWMDISWCQMPNFSNTMRTEGLGNPVRLSEFGLHGSLPWLFPFILNILPGSAKTELWPGSLGERYEILSLWNEVISYNAFAGCLNIYSLTRSLVFFFLLISLLPLHILNLRRTLFTDSPLTNKLFNSPVVSFITLQDQPGGATDAIWVYILKHVLQG